MMKNRVFLRLGLGITLIAASASLAEAKGRVRYGMAGCGVAGIIFEDDNEKWKQIVGAIVNYYFSGIHTFAISSGTSNCKTSDSGAAASLYLTIHKERITKDVARGDGESVETLAGLMGCKSAIPVQAVLSENYESILLRADRTGTEMRDDLIQRLKDRDDARKYCSLI